MGTVRMLYIEVGICGTQHFLEYFPLRLAFSAFPSSVLRLRLRLADFSFLRIHLLRANESSIRLIRRSERQRQGVWRYVNARTGPEVILISLELNVEPLTHVSRSGRKVLMYVELPTARNAENVTHTPRGTIMSQCQKKWKKKQFALSQRCWRF